MLHLIAAYNLSVTSVRAVSYPTHLFCPHLDRVSSLNVSMQNQNQCKFHQMSFHRFDCFLQSKKEGDKQFQNYCCFFCRRRSLRLRARPRTVRFLTARIGASRPNFCARLNSRAVRKLRALRFARDRLLRRLTWMSDAF